MNKSSRHLIALVMTAVYLLVVLAPLAPAALHSGLFAHALTGECSGECGICGCAPERSAVRACCCWQKKLAQKQAGKGKNARDCCKQENRATACSSRQHDCSGHDEHAGTTTAGNSSASSTDGSAIIAAPPCGGTGHLAFPGLENIQHYPFVYTASIPASPPVPYSPLPEQRLHSLHVEPSVPPPETAGIS